MHAVAANKDLEVLIWYPPGCRSSWYHFVQITIVVNGSPTCGLHSPCFGCGLHWYLVFTEKVIIRVLLQLLHTLIDTCTYSLIISTQFTVLYNGLLEGIWCNSRTVVVKTKVVRTCFFLQCFQVKVCGCCCSLDSSNVIILLGLCDCAAPVYLLDIAPVEGYWCIDTFELTSTEILHENWRHKHACESLENVEHCGVRPEQADTGILCHWWMM